jgi:SAM-dependent methyltransferase
MTLNQAAIRKLYESRMDRYSAFIGFFRTRRGLQNLLERRDVLHPRMKVLDAGCGFGTATFALLDALQAQGVESAQVDAFDLTPAMLARFRAELDARGNTHVQLREADMLDAAALPAAWKGYDLVISASMLEYLPKAQLPRALAALRARMAPQGRLLVMITRRSPETKVLIEWGWHAARYSADELRNAFAKAGFDRLQFVRFPLRYGWLNRANHVVVAQRQP